MKFAAIYRALAIAGIGARGGVMASPKLPKPLLTKLHAAFIKVLNEPEVQKIIYNQGATAVGSSPEEFRKYLLADMEKWKKVVAASGAKAN